MGLGRMLVRRFKRADKALAKKRARDTYERAIADGIPREQAKWLAKTAKRNYLR